MFRYTIRFKAASIICPGLSYFFIEPNEEKKPTTMVMPCISNRPILKLFSFLLTSRRVDRISQRKEFSAIKDIEGRAQGMSKRILDH